MREPTGLLSLSMVLFSALLLLGAPRPVMGQSASKDSELPFRITADSIESKDGGRILVGRGNVRVSRERWEREAGWGQAA